MNKDQKINENDKNNGWEIIQPGVVYLITNGNLGKKTLKNLIIPNIENKKNEEDFK